MKRPEHKPPDDAAQLRLIADNIPALAVAYDRDLRCVFANRRYAEFFGFTTATVVGKHLSEIIGVGPYHEVKHHYDRVFEGHPVTYERTRVLDNGEQRYLEVELIPHVDPDGRARGVFAVTSDATERKRTENALRESEARVREILANIGEIVYWLDFDLSDPFRGTVRFVSDRAREFAGRDPEAFRDDPSLWQRMIHPEDRDAVLRQTQTVIESGRPFTRYYRLLHGRTNAYRWFEDRVTVRRNATSNTASLIGVARDVTDRKTVEDALSASESMLRLVMENVPALIAYYSIDRVCRQANARYAQTFGLTAESIVGRTLRDIVGERGSAEIENHIAVAGEGNPVHYERVLADDPRRVMDVFLWPHTEHDGPPLGYFVLMLDITERRRAEEERARSSAELGRFKRVLDSTLDQIFMFDAQTLRFNYLNQGAVQSLGYTHEELLALHPYDIKPLMPEPAFRAFVAPLFSETKRALWFETLHRRKDGTDFPVEVFLQLVREDASDGRFIATVRDITERKRAEESLRTSEERFRTLAAAALEGIAISRQGILTDVNSQLCTMLGYTAEEMVGKPISGFVAPESRALVEARLGSESEAANEIRLLRKDKGVLDVITQAKAIDWQGQPARIAAIYDISERVRAERELRARTEELRIAQAAARMLVMDWVIGEDRLTWSDSPEWLRGPLPPSGIYPLYKDQVHPADRALFIANRERAIETKTTQPLDYRVVRTDGQILWVHSEHKIYAGTDGRADRMLVAILDVTERKRAEARISQLNATLERRVAERTEELRAALRELEAFSASVSHDLRAPARTVAGFGRIVLDDFGDRVPEECRRLIARIAKAGETMGAMIDGLLELSRVSRSEVARGPVDLVALAAEVWRDLAVADPMRRVELHLPETLTAQGDVVLLRSLLINLLSNGRKYTRHRPDPAIVLGRNEAGEFFVRDNGVGFDMQYAGKLFGAFQRLHGEREFEGHGIGLALVRKIVERHGGTVRAEAKPGEGATFYFTLQDGSP